MIWVTFGDVLRITTLYTLPDLEITVYPGAMLKFTVYPDAEITVYPGPMLKFTVYPDVEIYSLPERIITVIVYPEEVNLLLSDIICARTSYV